MSAGSVHRNTRTLGGRLSTGNYPLSSLTSSATFAGSRPAPRRSTRPDPSSSSTGDAKIPANGPP